jgi:hypothetical protein
MLIKKLLIIKKAPSLAFGMQRRLQPFPKQSSKQKTKGAPKLVPPADAKENLFSPSLSLMQNHFSISFSR